MTGSPLTVASDRTDQHYSERQSFTESYSGRFAQLSSVDADCASCRSTTADGLFNSTSGTLLT